MEILVMGSHTSDMMAHFRGREFIRNIPMSFQSRRHSGLGTQFNTQARGKLLRKKRKVPEYVSEIVLDEFGSTKNKSPEEADFVPENDLDAFNEKLDAQNLHQTSSRSGVLQACILTCSLIFAVGMTIRLAFHFAFTEGWEVFDSTEVSFDFEIWHLQLIGVQVLFVSSCRYLLLKVWPDFAESSNKANEQVLGPLNLLDYAIVAFLPGISEELLFRGALLPALGLSWTNALLVGAIFGALHLGGGRKYSFAIWATFVGFIYGSATILSSSIFVPMAAHSLNNLVGAVLWRYASSSEKKLL